MPVMPSSSSPFPLLSDRFRSPVGLRSHFEYVIDGPNFTIYLDVFLLPRLARCFLPVLSYAVEWKTLIGVQFESLATPGIGAVWIVNFFSPLTPFP